MRAGIGNVLSILIQKAMESSHFCFPNRSDNKSLFSSDPSPPFCETSMSVSDVCQEQSTGWSLFLLIMCFGKGPSTVYIHAHWITSLTQSSIVGIDIHLENLVTFFLFNQVMLLICGALVNGPYALITTAVSADLVSMFLFYM